MTSIRLNVDVQEAYRGMIHVDADLPVVPGLAKFTTPLWIAESHMANGPVASIAGLYFSTKERTLSWRRDPKAPYIYIVDVPEGVSMLRASFDAVGIQFATRRMLMLLWETVLIHPAYTPVRNLEICASVVVPPDWAFATALRVRTKSKNTIHFAETSVYRLEDSPVLIGQHVRETSISKKHFLCAAGSHEVAVPPTTMTKLQRLVKETGTVLGDLPYSSFRFLIMMSEHLMPRVGEFTGGMEHAESCFIVGPPTLLTDPNELDKYGDVICHEYFHVWNGKHLRPNGHLPEDFTTPLVGSLLWVYEGLTQYYGLVLAVRCGIIAPSSYRAKLAQTAAMMENQAGRRWRSIEDTGAGVALGHGQVMGRSTTSWSNWLRGPDYYMEGVLLWLEVDTIIRQTTNRSLDDFSFLFFHRRLADEVTYTLDQLVSCLYETAPYDWNDLMKRRVGDVDANVNFQGINRAGYDVVYTSEPSKSQSTQAGDIDMIWNTIGVRIGQDGVIQDVRRFSVADIAKIAPAQVVKQVEDKPFTLNALVHCIREKGSLSFVLDHQEDTLNVTIDNVSPRYPKLQRRAGRDILAAIIAPRSDVT